MKWEDLDFGGSASLSDGALSSIWLQHVCTHIWTHVATEPLLKHTLPFSTQSKCRWVNIDFISSKVGFSSSALHGTHYCVLTILIHPKLPPQPRLSPAKPITRPNRSCFDCHLITHRLLHNLPVKRRGWLGGMWRGWCTEEAPVSSPSMSAASTKGSHDRGWVVIKQWPCLQLKVTPFLIALRDGR